MKLTPKWEFMAHSTLQQNGLVEVEFSTIARRARTMCTAAHMSDHICILFVNEVHTYSTSLSNLVVDKDKVLMHYQLMGLQNPNWAEPRVMQTYGEAGVGCCDMWQDRKLGNKRIPMVFLGYAKNHSHYCYCMWNPASRMELH